jgi:hypothetical protein
LARAGIDDAKGPAEIPNELGNHDIAIPGPLPQLFEDLTHQMVAQSRSARFIEPDEHIRPHAFKMRSELGMAGDTEESRGDPHEVSRVPQVKRKEADGVRVPVLVFRSDTDGRACHGAAIRPCGEC